MIYCVEGLESVEKDAVLKRKVEELRAPLFNPKRDIERWWDVKQELYLFEEFLAFCEKFARVNIVSSYCPAFSYYHFPQLRAYIWAKQPRFNGEWVKLVTYDPESMDSHQSVYNELFTRVKYSN